MQSKTNLSKILLVYFSIFLFFTLIFILSFHLPLFKSQKVLFYRGMGLLAFSALLTSVFAVLINKWAKISLETPIAALAVTISLHLSFFIVFPVTFDRSVTMYLLSALKEKSSQDISEKKLEQFFINEYVIDQKAIRRRIIEQSIINMIEEKNNSVKLTSKGKNFLDFSNLIKTIYSIK